jgi:hypothetical protein
MRLNNAFFHRGTFKIGKGTCVHFWENIWVGNSSLANKYQALYNIAQRKHVLIASVLSNRERYLVTNRMFGYVCANI